jgi:isopentenyl diphosphate isomerase/L-lactate dehydrogenase-like FMN-dependent dehydrogenase
MELSSLSRSSADSHSPTWDDLVWMRREWDGPLVVKGILTVDDARRARAIGADAIVVSNHGGRQLDGAPASMRVLPDIADAVGADMEVLVDSGVRRGSDVVRALASGAKAVLLGRPAAFGLAAAGQPGVRHVLQQVRAQLERTMQLVGAADVADLDSSWITAAGRSRAEAVR